MHSTDNLLRRLKELNEIGIALSRQRDINSLLETILEAAKRITHADAGTLYLHEPEKRVLRFEIMRTDSLNIAMGGTSGVPITFYPIQLYDEAGNPNHNMVAPRGNNRRRSQTNPSAPYNKNTRRRVKQPLHSHQNDGLKVFF